MDEKEMQMFRDIVLSRVAKSQERLKNRRSYLELLAHQNESETEIVAILGKLDRDERTTVERHYESELDLVDLETKEAYVQGLRDGIAALGLLGVFNSEVFAW